jgi:hypothetical protein
VGLMKIHQKPTVKLTSNRSPPEKLNPARCGFSNRKPTSTYTIPTSTFSDQDTQILSTKDNFHVDLDVNVIDSNEQRVINDAQIDILRNADVASNDASRVESNVVSNEMFRVISISSIQIFFIKIFAHKTKYVFSKNIFCIIFKMSNARISKTIRLIKFVL